MEQTRIAQVDGRAIKRDWMMKYPPPLIGPEVFGGKIDRILLSSDAVGLGIRNGDQWIDDHLVSKGVHRALQLGTVLISWGVLASIGSFDQLADFILAHACGETEIKSVTSYDLNSRYLEKTMKFESRVIVEPRVYVLISTFLAGMHTEVKLARDIALLPKFGCLDY
ncbi:MAG: hypothetical protein KDB03_05155 [Planctomycetales bacterium]|nr:hypothetical protein [Planctomycetales bacterium]